jgi:hypothetical protein
MLLEGNQCVDHLCMKTATSGHSLRSRLGNNKHDRLADTAAMMVAAADNCNSTKGCNNTQTKHALV